MMIGTVIRSASSVGTVWIGAALPSTGIAFGDILPPGLIKRDFRSRVAGLICLYAAALTGMTQLIGSVGAVAGPLRVGVLRDATGSWAPPLLLPVATSALVIVSATFAPASLI